jgi:muramoyltetrapeptide carboxypeptidase LdcA involved in peptidoglycan recycling
VLMDADLGHRPQQMLWINGAMAELSFDDGRARLTQRG